MCHEYHSRNWNHERASDGPESDGAEDDAAELPPFFNESEPEDVELLTDGGDE